MLAYCVAQGKRLFRWLPSPKPISGYQIPGNDMKTKVKWIEDVSFVVETGSGHAVLVDGAPDAGGRNLGPRPMELVLAGTAACTAFDVVWILKKARQPIGDLRRRGGSRAGGRGSQGLHSHPLHLSGERRGAQSGAGRARGQALEGEILLGHADAGQDRADQLRDRAGAEGRLTCESWRPLPRVADAHRGGSPHGLSRSRRMRLDVSQRPPPRAWMRA